MSGRRVNLSPQRLCNHVSAQPEEIGQLEDPLIQAYKQAWSDVLAQQQQLVNDPVQASKRARLVAMRASIEDTMEEIDATTRVWIQSHLPQVFGLGAAGGATDAGAGTFVWNQISQEAVQRLAQRLYDNLKNAHQYVDKTTRELISSVVRDKALKSAIQGDTATQAAREMRRILESKGIHAVTYTDGSKHGLAEYSRMAIRTETATAFNEGTLHGAKDCLFFQIADGPECGLSYHDDPTLALGMIVDRATASKYLISHPNCRRAFGPRPDVKTPEEAKTAESFITPAQTKAQREADQVARGQQRRQAATKARTARKEATKTKTLAARQEKLAQRDIKTGKVAPPGLPPNQFNPDLDSALSAFGNPPSKAVLGSVPDDAEGVAAWLAAGGQEAQDWKTFAEQWSDLAVDSSKIAQEAKDGSTARGLYLSGALKNAPESTKSVYRGFNQLKPLKAGETLDLDASAFTLSKDIAQGYADAADNPALLIISGASKPKILPVKGLSSFDTNEMEVISGGKFKVLTANVDAEGQATYVLSYQGPIKTAKSSLVPKSVAIEPDQFTAADLSFKDKTGIGVKAANARKKAKLAGASDEEIKAISDAVTAEETAKRVEALNASGGVGAGSGPKIVHKKLPDPSTVLAETQVSKVPSIADLVDKGWDPSKVEAEHKRLLLNARNQDRRARNKLLGISDETGEVVEELDPIAKLIADDLITEGQPRVLHSAHQDGPGGAGPWHSRLIQDTAPGEYVPVRNLEMGGHVVKDGIAVRRNGVTYLLETPDGSVVTDAMQAELEAHVKVVTQGLNSVPASARQYQKGVAVLRHNNPADAYWAKEYGIPDFKSAATGGDGATIFWNSQPRVGTVLHEFGHNLDRALGDGPGMPLHLKEGIWKKTQFFDSETSQFHVDHGFKSSIKTGHELTPGSVKGVTTYGQASLEEDFAESTRLYLQDRHNGYLGYTKLDGKLISVRFADVFPARAAFLDEALGLPPVVTPFQAVQKKKALEAYLKVDGAIEGSALQTGYGISQKASHEILTDLGPKTAAKLKTEAAAKAAAANAAEVAAAIAKANAKVLTKADLSFADKTGIGVKKANAIKKAKLAGATDAEAKAAGAAIEAAEIQIRLQKLAARGDGVVQEAQQVKATGSAVMRKYNSKTNASATKFLKKAGQEPSSLAKVVDHGVVEWQAKANIAADIGGRLNNEKDWEVFRRYEAAKTRSASIKVFDAYSDAERQALLDTEVRFRVHEWALSSGDSRLDPVLMQRAIKEEFGTTGDYLVRGDSAHLTREQVDASYAQKGEWYRRVAREMYNNTQDAFKAEGITHVSVYRGMQFTGVTPPEWARTKFTAAETAAIEQKPGAYVNSFVASKDNPRLVQPELQPANSWSSSEAVSKKFGDTMFRAEIPVEQIIGSARTGFGCLNEKEFVVFDSVGLIELYQA